MTDPHSYRHSSQQFVLILYIIVCEHKKLAQISNPTSSPNMEESLQENAPLPSLLFLLLVCSSSGSPRPSIAESGISELIPP